MVDGGERVDVKEILVAQVREIGSAVAGRNVAREYLQARILSSLQRQGAMIPLAFHGGTALRFLYGLPRYSEDLDFALEGDRAGYDFRGYLTQIKRTLAAEGYPVEVKLNAQKVVHSAFVRFRGLLFELGLSPHADEVLAVKVEVDTNPPAGAGLATTLIRRYVTLQLQHHDKPSLLAGKLHALLQRRYTKGRDVYDLIWYLSDPEWPAPNLTLLNNALAQTGWEGPLLAEETWQAVVYERLAAMPWERVVQDVRPFLIDAGEESLLTLENVGRILER